MAEIEAEQRLVAGNRQLIARMEQKIAATLARIWGDTDDADPTKATCKNGGTREAVDCAGA